MPVRDSFSIRRPLDSPVGIAKDFVGSQIEEVSLAKLANSPTLFASVERDTLPIPSTRNREGYYRDRHFEYWLSGFSDYIQIREVYPAARLRGARLLDFGGATGRVARHFFVQEELAEVMVCDVNINNVTWVLEHLHGINAFKNSPIPSLPLPGNSFDLITAFSVFTHMNEYELAWLYELKRILKPGGLLCVTVHNDDTWRILPTTWVYNVLQKSKEFQAIYSANAPLKERHAFEYSSESVYNCNTFHPNSYIHRTWGRILTVLEIRPRFHSYQSGVLLGKEI